MRAEQTACCDATVLEANEAPVVDVPVPPVFEDRLRPAAFADRTAWFAALKERLASRHPADARPRVTTEYAALIEGEQFFPTTVLLHHGATGNPTAGGCLVWPLHDDAHDLYTRTIPGLSRQLLDGNGVGIDLSVLTPRLLANARGQASPGVMETLIALTRAFDGPLAYVGLKRAAFMASLVFDHPDIFEFVTHKRRQSLACANLSVAVDDRYIEGLDRHAHVPLRWQTPAGDDIYLRRDDLDAAAARARHRGVPPPDLHVNAGGEVLSRAAGAVVGCVVDGLVMVELSRLHEQIALAAHDCGDPGLLNLDAINRHNPTHPRHAAPGADPSGDGLPGVGFISTTAPCGEQPLLPYESCFLGSFNLPRFLRGGAFDFAAFRTAIPPAVGLLDDMIDIAPQPDPEMHRALESCRKIGLGVMGLADVLAEAELPYDSEAARGLASEILQALHEGAVDASRSLARTRGAFPRWEQSVYARDGQPARRHATVTTIAPTGHISRLAGCAPSMEPFFGFRSELHGSDLSSVLGRKLAETGFSLLQWLTVSQEKHGSFEWDGTLGQLAPDPTDRPEVNARLRELQRIFKTASEIDAQDHLAMLSAVAPHVENGVSKTVNLPEATSVGEIADLFEKALRAGLKGITVFRANCSLGNWR